MHKINPKRYTIIYFNLCDGWELSYEEYLIIDTMVFYSRKNVFNYGIKFLMEYLQLSRNTITSYLDRLTQSGYIERENKSYRIHLSLLEDFQDKSGENFVRIYHAHRHELGISILEYALLSYFYSQSRRSGICHAHFSFTHKKIGISERMYYFTKRKFKNKGIIEPLGGYRVKLSKTIRDWFDKIW